MSLADFGAGPGPSGQRLAGGTGPLLSGGRLPGPPEAGIALVTWANEEPTGGNVYNARLAAALRNGGRPVEIARVPGSWPEPERGARERLADVLSGRPVSLVDGIVASHAPEAVESATGVGRVVVILVHLPLGVDRPDPVEARALGVATAVICTSYHGAELISRHYGIRANVALPGADEAPRAAGSEPPRMLSVASLTPIKDQLTLVRALAMINDLDWSAALVGSTTADPGYADEVRTLINSVGLAERVTITGTLTGAPLEEQWAAADLLLLVSRTETYGLVVTEAIAHGIPAIVGAGTGAEEALHGADGTSGVLGADEPVGTSHIAGFTSLPGCMVPVADPPALSAALRDWLIDANLRACWRAAALQRRASLPTWAGTAAAVEQCLVVLGS